MGSTFYQIINNFSLLLQLYVIFSQSKSHIFIGCAVTPTIKFITKLSRNKCCRKITPSAVLCTARLISPTPRLGVCYNEQLPAILAPLQCQKPISTVKKRAWHRMHVTNQPWPGFKGSALIVPSLALENYSIGLWKRWQALPFNWRNERLHNLCTRRSQAT